MDNMTTEEKKVVEELRKRTINEVTPKMLEDASVFYRFAKARDFNLVDAENMLRKHIAWRKEMGIDTILTDYKPPEVLVKYAPTTFICFDKKGNAVRLQDCGRADVRGLSSIVTRKEWEKYNAFIIEQDLEKLIKQRGNHGNPPFFSLEDFENLTYANALSISNLQFLLNSLKMFLNNYPEILSTVVVINAPFYFSWIFAAIKKILPSSVIEKVRIYGKDGWKEFLCDEIDVDKLPAYLGGNMTDPDGNPLCETFINRGRTIPKCYYKQNRMKKLSQESDVEKITLLPFSKEEITFKVKEDSSCLEWELETKSRDVHFSLLFGEDSSENLEPSVLISKQKVDSGAEPEKGCFKCERKGNYTIVFDNSFDRRSKVVYCKAGIKIQNNNVYNSTQ